MRFTWTQAWASRASRSGNGSIQAFHDGVSLEGGAGVRGVAALVIEDARRFGNGLQVADVFNNGVLVDNAL